MCVAAAHLVPHFHLFFLLPHMVVPQLVCFSTVVIVHCVQEHGSDRATWSVTGVKMLIVCERVGGKERGKKKEVRCTHLTSPLRYPALVLGQSKGERKKIKDESTDWRH